MRRLGPGWLEAARIAATIQISGDGEAGLRFAGSGIVEDLLVGVQRFTDPVSRDFVKKTVLDGVPFGSAGRIVGHGDGQGEGVGHLGLEFRFPGAAAIAVATAGVGQDEDFSRARVVAGTFPVPPVSDGFL